MKKTLTILTAAFLTLSATAQSGALRSAYFLDGYNHRNSFNPAFAAQRSFFSVGGSLNFDLLSNMGVNSFLFPLEDGTLTTFMSPQVSPDMFLSGISKNNRINADFSTTLLSLGIHGKKSYVSFDANLRTGANISLPYELFEFMKNAGNNNSYRIRDIAAEVGARIEYALGYSTSIGSKVNFGARLKFLMGIGDINARIDHMDLRMDENEWSVTSEGYLNMFCGLADIPTKEDNILDFSNISFTNELGYNNIVSGYGAAVDLGAEFKVLPGLRVSAAICDLGYMSWKNGTMATTGERGWRFSGFDEISIDDGNTDIDEQLKNIGNDLSDMFEFTRLSNDGTKKDFLDFTVNLGAEMAMPFYKALSLGIMSSTVVSKQFTRTDNRLYANLEPCKWFSMAVNGALSSFGESFGFAIGLHTAGINFFLGTDFINTGWAKANDSGMVYPYGKIHTNLHFGTSINVGKRHEQ